MAPKVDMSEKAGHGNQTCIIPRVALLRVLQGVIVATKTSEEGSAPVVRWLSSYEIPHQSGGSGDDPQKDVQEDASAGLSLYEWKKAVVLGLSGSEDSRHVANVALGVAFLRQKSRQSSGTSVAGADLEAVWSLIYDAITDSSLTSTVFAASRSAQGFLAVPLCSIVENGNIDELFRFHVWLPDAQRGSRDFAIHSHQTFAQSWVLAGEGNDHSFKMETASDVSAATHAKYALAWNDGKSLSKTYNAHQSYSIVVNTGDLVSTTLVNTTIHPAGTSYSIPAAQLHRTEVEPDVLHATLFFFDSRRGFVQDAVVLGPKDGESFKQLRDPAGVTPKALAEFVRTMRTWESYMRLGEQHSQRAEWEDALRVFNSALNYCQSEESFPNAARYQPLVLGQLGNTYRRFGRYEQAKEALSRAVAQMKPSSQSVELSGELGVVYRHMDRLLDAKDAFEHQYEMAKQLELTKPICRAIGNLGIVNYQLYLQNHNHALLDLAIEQLLDRVRIARSIHHSIWESIGLSRLSLCYTAHGDLEKAIESASQAFEITSGSADSTVIAISRFFYGRALLLGGQHQEALGQFSPRNTCTPAMAFCKEPSEEHRQYLRELVDSRTDMDCVDEHGYTALDYAVFNDDAESQKIVLEGLRQTLGIDAEHELALRQTEARLRKGYRDLFQEQLRPKLLATREGDSLQHVRQVYAEALAADKENRKMFDVLKFVPYTDFLRAGKLPGSSDNLTQQLSSQHGDLAEYIIFVSYRWINRDPTVTSPDDSNHTQYKRMIDATNEFLQLHPSVDRDMVGLWVDHACVNQDDPMPGVSALPMIVAQCNAVISLVDEEYHTRAWCSVEVMMVQTLKRSYNLHLWYEQVPAQADGSEGDGGGRKWMLREGPMDLKISMAQKRLSFEADRPKVLFLERQSRLLG